MATAEGSAAARARDLVRVEVGVGVLGRFWGFWVLGLGVGVRVRIKVRSASQLQLEHVTMRLASHSGQTSPPQTTHAVGGAQSHIRLVHSSQKVRSTQLSQTSCSQVVARVVVAV